MTGYVQKGGVQVAQALYDFINEQAIPGTGIDAERFWAGVDTLINDLAPKNKALLEKRDALQAKIDAYHQERKGKAHNAEEYKAFLQEIGYLLPEGEAFEVTTENVEPEIGQLAGPQLVVPITNARLHLTLLTHVGVHCTTLYTVQTLSQKRVVLKRAHHTTKYAVTKLSHGHATS